MPYAQGVISKGAFQHAPLDSLEDALDDKRNLYVYDARKGGAPLHETILKCKCLLIASPNETHFSEFQNPLPETLYMPLWTLEELLVLCETRYKRVDARSVRERFVR